MCWAFTNIKIMNQDKCCTLDWESSDLVDVVGSVRVYQPPVEGPLLIRTQPLRKSVQMFGELFTQLGVIGQSVAVKTNHV